MISAIQCVILTIWYVISVIQCLILASQCMIYIIPCVILVTQCLILPARCMIWNAEVVILLAECMIWDPEWIDFANQVHDFTNQICDLEFYRHDLVFWMDDFAYQICDLTLIWQAWGSDLNNNHNDFHFWFSQSEGLILISKRLSNLHFKSGHLLIRLILLAATTRIRSRHGTRSWKTGHVRSAGSPRMNFPREWSSRRLPHRPWRASSPPYTRSRSWNWIRVK